MGDNKEPFILGEVSQVPVIVDPVTAELSPLVIHTTPFDLIIGLYFMRKMRASLDFDKDVA